MNARIIVTNTGSITILIDEAVDAEAAQRVSQAMMDSIAQALQIQIVVSPPEQHGHGAGYEHQLAHTHAAPHAH